MDCWVFDGRSEDINIRASLIIKSEIVWFGEMVFD